jgi:putative SOS response-associated peptidase YedK
MPVVLESKDFASWLNDGGPALLKPAANDVLQRWPVSRRVNSSRAAATFNARAETVAEKPFFRDAFRRTRCLIPASGYYEWQDTATGKQPWYFTRADGEPMTFAGLWDEWKDKATGEVLKSCTMLITEPNAAPWGPHP